MNIFLLDKSIMGIPIIKFFILAILVQTIYSVEHAFEDTTFCDVVEHDDVTLTCTHNDVVTIVEYTTTSDEPNYVVQDSVLVDNRFIYMNTTVNDTTVHKIVIKDVLGCQHNYNYVCSKLSTIEIVPVTIRVIHRPPAPICITNFYTKWSHEPTILECISEEAYPRVMISPIVEPESSSYGSYSYDFTIDNRIRNETHVSLKTTITDTVDDVSSFTCATHQNLPVDVLLPVAENTCYFTMPAESSFTTIVADHYVNVSNIVYRSIPLILTCLYAIIVGKYI